jgi:hypothetical protein
MRNSKIIFQVVSFILFAISTTLSSCQGQSKNQKTIPLSTQDAQTIKTILKFSIASMDTVSEEMYADFWKVVKKNGGNPNDINEIGPKETIKKFMSETAISYQRAFYEDAMISVRTGKPFESKKRKVLSTKLEKDRMEKNELLMINIANKTPIPYNNEEIVLDEEIIKRILENLDAAFILFEHNLDILYSKIYHK